MALGNAYLRELSFSLDTALGHSDVEAARREGHVFVAGLARAGTSLLLRILHGTGAFVSLSYRDMPFVLAPGLWGRVTGRFHKDGAARERAHGDGLDVDFDTPEAFEEVFWLTFAGHRYVGADTLSEHGVDDETIAHFRQYVANVITRRRSSGPARYLSKNNNNILRLPAVLRAFREARAIVPLRNPLQHAASILRQHQKFSTRHRDDAFSRRYMCWLGHFEFGADHRPFRFGDTPFASPDKGPDTLDYWLRYWVYVHEALLERLEDRIFLFDYDGLCQEPSHALARLADVVDIPSAALEEAAGAVRAPAEHRIDAPDEQLLAAANRIHEMLRARAI